MGITERVGENKPEQPFHNGSKISNNARARMGCESIAHLAEGRMDF